jgi:hypothetical protein
VDQVLGQDQHTLHDLHNWVRESQEISSVWRTDSWVAEEFRDGEQYTQADYDKLFNAGIDPLTINRVFPTVNLLLGLQIVNKYDTGIKGRTQKDTELGQLMAEGIKFIDDQWGTEFLITQAYKDQIVPGIGWMTVLHSNDPREEKIRTAYRDWKEMWWDPFSDPWIDPRKCRYVFHQPWMDVDSLIAMFPAKRQELEDYSRQTDGDRRNNSQTNIWYDEAQQIEDLKMTYGGRSRQRRRVRPVEMWYPIYETGLWAKFRDKTARPILDSMPKLDQLAMIREADEVVKATTLRMWTTTFLDDIVLNDMPTPFNHDLYPFVPFVGYINRYGFPFGVPHQMRGQQVEINKRRSMALALLQKRRVIAESGVVPKGENSTKDLQHLYEEANKLDGFMVIEAGKSGAFKIIEGTDKGALQAQVLMLHESERELKEISGANDEQAGYKGQAISGIAQQKRQDQSSTILAPLAEHLRRSRKMVGTLQVAEIQGQWTSERVLRVTDRMTGAEKFATLNERVWNKRTGAYEIKNNVTQGIFDTIITEAPPTDTVREQNMNLLIEWAKKSPPDIIPQIMLMAMDLSNLPNKDMLLGKLKEIVGVNPEDEDLSVDERKQRVIDALEQHKQQAQKEALFQEQLKILALKKAGLENELLQAQIETTRAGGNANIMKAKAADDKVKIDGFKVGAEVAAEQKRREAEERERYARTLNQDEKGAAA